MEKDYHDDSEYQDKDLVEILKPQGPGFDHRTEIRHPRTGELLKKQDYAMTVTKSGNGSVRIYERGNKKSWEDGSNATDKDIVETLGPTHELLSAKSRFSSLGEALQKKNSDRMKAQA